MFLQCFSGYKCWMLVLIERSARERRDYQTSLRWLPEHPLWSVLPRPDPIHLEEVVVGRIILVGRALRHVLIRSTLVRYILGLFSSEKSRVCKWRRTLPRRATTLFQHLPCSGLVGGELPVGSALHAFNFRPAGAYKPTPFWTPEAPPRCQMPLHMGFGNAVSQPAGRFDSRTSDVAHGYCPFFQNGHDATGQYFLHSRPGFGG